MEYPPWDYLLLVIYLMCSKSKIRHFFILCMEHSPPYFPRLKLSKADYETLLKITPVKVADLQLLFLILAF